MAERLIKAHALRALRAELREATAHMRRHLAYATVVKRMTCEEIADTWGEPLEPWQHRLLALHALRVDPVLRLEWSLEREGVKADRPTSEIVLALAEAIQAAAPVRSPLAVSRDLLTLKYKE